MYGRPAAVLRLRDQRLVVRVRGLEGVRTDHPGARIVAVAVSPGRRRRRPVANDLAAPLPLETKRAVAAEVTLVGPERAVGVKVLRREDVDWKRLNPRRRGAVAGRADKLNGAAPRAGSRRVERADQPVLLRVTLDLR